jgi:hypothetical protein
MTYAAVPQMHRTGKKSPAEAGQGLILEGNQDEDTAIDTQFATVLRLEGFQS